MSQAEVPPRPREKPAFDEKTKTPQQPEKKMTASSFSQLICKAAEREADAAKIDRGFLIRLLYKESMFNPNAVSPKGAQGLAQFMPGTADRVGLDDPFDPEKAIRASARFLAGLKSRFGNLGLAAAAYNAGEGRVDKWLAGQSGMPYETQDYVAFITGKEVEEWRVASADHSIPAIGKDETFKANCIALASRTVTVSGKRVVKRTGLAAIPRAKPQPWGAVLAADFSEARAFGMFNRLRLRFPNKIRNVHPMVVNKVNLSRGRRPMAMVMIGAATQQAATAQCRALVSEGIPCVVRKN